MAPSSERPEAALPPTAGNRRAEEGAPFARARPDDAIVAASPAMRGVLEEARRVARFDAPVLIEGETGVGKELLSRYVHRHSPRRAGPLVAVNCGAVPDGLLETEFFGHARGAFTGATVARPGLLAAATGGVLFLDEVGELSPRGQALLLRALQEREFRRVGETLLRRADFRLITATHRNLEGMVSDGVFRSDLMYRIRVVRLRLPPLRDRPGDVPPLARSLLVRAAGRIGLTRIPRLPVRTLAWLARREWPGNVRELESALISAVLRNPGVPGLLPAHFEPGDGGSTAESEDDAEARPADPIPGEAARALEIEDLAEARAAFERLCLLKALRLSAGSRALAARRLGLSRQTLYLKLRRHRISR